MISGSQHPPPIRRLGLTQNLIFFHNPETKIFLNPKYPVSSNSSDVFGKNFWNHQANPPLKPLEPGIDKTISIIFKLENKDKE